jgi:hypothetical protein
MPKCKASHMDAYITKFPVAEQAACSRLLFSYVQMLQLAIVMQV